MRQFLCVTHFWLVAVVFAAISGSQLAGRSCLAAETSEQLPSINQEVDSNAEVAESQHHHQQQQSRYVHPKPDGVEMGCKELTSKRYISDGFCTSVKPITERVCGGLCLPLNSMPWYAEYVKVWSHTKLEEWRCVDDRTRRHTVTLVCKNGDTRRYTIRIVNSCRCKQFNRVHNQSSANVRSRRRLDSSTGTEDEDAATPIERVTSMPSVSRSNGRSVRDRRRRRRGINKRT